MRHALSIDLEEFFQIHALSDVISEDSWKKYPSSVESNTGKILELLESRNITATFFCLGWIAENHPDLIKRIHCLGHEIACHGYSHQVIYNQDRNTFYQDVSKAKKILEDITGSPVIGYRAPTYSITKKTIWAIDILEDLGFRYDSSIFPIYHDNYGIPDAPRLPHIIKGTALVEFPISTLTVGGYNIPISGGGYFRLFPYLITKNALRVIEKRNEPFVFYIHPWELNPQTPRIEGMSLISRFRTYIGITRAFARFSTLIDDFSFTTLSQVLEDQGLLK
ncbi:MAG: DUF3473 domain-containing protein [Deltaproteobacteria bacterium]|nr:DUF3473 domain-containing protein [Deltaproteobacteria bacterium]